MSRIRNHTDTLARWNQATRAVSQGASSTSFSSLLQQPQRSSANGTDASSFERRRGPGPGKPPFLDAAANALGLTTDELDARLKSGEQLTDIASSQGVSTDILTEAIASDFKTKHPDATDDEAAAVAGRVLEGPPSRERTEQRPTPPWLDTAAQTLGLSADELSTRLQNGERLADLAAAQGVSTDTLQEALSTHFAAAHPNATATEATEAAQGLLSAHGPSDLRSFRLSELQLRTIEP
jgi:uncharacterized protein YidB (DUF937 family)